MISIRQSIFFSGVIVLLSSCSPKIPFTQSIREQYKLTAEDMKGIQFYLSDPVALRRGASSENQKATEEGTLIVKSGKSYEEVNFKANTPGVVEQIVDVNKITVAFEDGKEKYLVFGSGNDRNGYYRLQAIGWEGGKGKINYGGQTYFSNVGSDATILFFKMKSLKDIKVDSKTVKGKKIK
ncbi:hypothetical protein BH11BAC2_BH11BAC2_21570 [soil metagenome]